MAVVPSGKYTKKGAIIWKAAPRRQPTRRKSTTPTPSKRTPVAYGGPTREASTTQITEAKAKGLDYTRAAYAILLRANVLHQQRRPLLLLKKPLLLMAVLEATQHQPR